MELAVRPEEAESEIMIPTSLETLSKQSDDKCCAVTL